MIYWMVEFDIYFSNGKVDGFDKTPQIIFVLAVLLTKLNFVFFCQN